MPEGRLLENPIWYALNSHQRNLGRGNAQAAVYDFAVSRFAGLEVYEGKAFSDLSAMLSSSDRVALFTAVPVTAPSDWQVLRARSLEQMVCRELRGDGEPLQLQLATADVPDMLALAEATEPGPFFSETIKTGRYFGIRLEGRLAAMAGERLRITGFTEISAVCTDPDYRGKGLARRLVAGLTATILGEGNVPFLHVKNENGAKALYEALGYHVARTIHLTVMQKL
jgi:ribosomal protein S18 acetylase RimI-like enzyme